MNIDLKSLVAAGKVKRKNTLVMFDEDHQVGFQVNFLSKTELQRKIGKHTSIDYVRGQKEEKVNNKALTEEIMEECVTGWTGVTVEWLSTQTPIDLESVEDPKADIPFNQDNLKVVCDASYTVENFIFEAVKDAAKFSKKLEAEIKN